MRLFLLALFASFGCLMLGATIWTCQQQSIFKIPTEVWQNPWFLATLLDTYLSFLTIYTWVCLRERSWLVKGIWLVLFLGLGTMAHALYIVLALLRMPTGDWTYLMLGPEASLAARSPKA